MIPYFRDQTLHSISGRPRIIAAPPEGLDEINSGSVLGLNPTKALCFLLKGDFAIKKRKFPFALPEKSLSNAIVYEQERLVADEEDMLAMDKTSPEIVQPEARIRLMRMNSCNSH